MPLSRWAIADVVSYANMNIAQVGMVFIRVSGISFCVESMLVLTYLPTDLIALTSKLPANRMSIYEFDAWMTVIRFLLYAGMGVIFLIFAKPLAKLLTRSLESSQAEQEQSGIWPPPPSV